MFGRKKKHSLTRRRILYRNSVCGANIATGNLVEIIGEELLIIDGESIDCYIYKIVGYEAENGLPFAALKQNITIFDSIPEA